MNSIFHTIPIFLLSKLGYQNNRVSSKKEREKKRKGLRIHTQTLYLAKFSMEYLTPPPPPPLHQHTFLQKGRKESIDMADANYQTKPLQFIKVHQCLDK